MSSPLTTSDMKSSNAWKVPFWTFFIGQALSQIGSAVTQFIIMWWLTVETASVTVLSTAGLFALLPQALLSPLGGVFADRYSRKLILVVTDSISAVCIVLLMFSMASGKMDLHLIYAMLFVRSSMQAFQGPASQASVENLVPTDFIPTAAGLNQSVMGLVSIASAPLGAIALGMFPIHQSLWIDVATALISVFSLLFISIPQPSLDQNSKSHIWTDFKEGFFAIYNNVGFRRLFYIFGTVAVFLLPCFTLFTLLVTQHFQGGEKMAGLFGALSGAGMLLGGLVVAVAKPKKQIQTFLVAWVISCLTVTATALPGASAVWIALVAWFVSGFGFTYGSAPLTSFLQIKVPNHLQGRVFSILNVLVGLSAPIGLAIIVPLGESVSVRTIMIALSILAGVVCVIGLATKSIRNLDS